MRVCIYMCVCTRERVGVFVCVQACVQEWVWVCVCVCVCVCVFTWRGIRCDPSRCQIYNYVWWLIHVCTWLIHMCDMTHSCVWHGSFICVTHYTLQMMPFAVYTRQCNTRLFELADSYTWHDSYVGHDSFIHVTWCTSRYIRGSAIHDSSS